MKPLLLATLCLCVNLLQAQYWNLTGNSNASSTTSKLGTTNNIPLRLFTNNAERLRLDGSGNLNFMSGLQSLKFPNPGTTSNPMIYMYSSGFTNNPRMVIAHSPGAKTFGLKYTDVGDKFEFIGNGDSHLSINMVSGNIGMGTSNPAHRLQVEGEGLFTASVFVKGNTVIDNQVAIGTTPTHYKLDIHNNSLDRAINVNNTYKGNTNHYGIWVNAVNNPGYGSGVWAQGGWRGVTGEAIMDNASGGIGVAGYANGQTGTGTRYGVIGWASGGANAYGVYGGAGNGSSFTAAGYFAGNVYAAQYFTTSDRKFKTSVEPITNPLGQLLKLRPASYQFKTSDFKKMNLPAGRQIGLIADEVKEVFPELVQAAVHPAEYDKDNKKVSEEVKYEGVNYQGLIPVLVAAIQEQQQQIEVLKKEIAVLKQGSNTTRSHAYLEQNTPNPFKNTTVIRYYIPDNVRSANLVVLDMKGAIVRSIAVKKGSGQVTVNTSALAVGTYNYSLWIDGVSVDSRQMVIVR